MVPFALSLKYSCEIEKKEKEKNINSVTEIWIAQSLILFFKISEFD